MLHSLLPLLPTVIGSDGPQRRRRRRPPRQEEPREEGLGNWIWISAPENTRNSYLYARKTFKLASKPDKATLKATADSAYKLFVNGRYVGEGPVPGGHEFVYSDSHDVTDLMNKGENVIAFLVHHIGENTFSYSLAAPGLLCRLELETDGEETIIGSDETWKVYTADDWTAQGERLSQGLGFQEVYDAAGAIDGWNEVKFKEKGWQDAVVVGAPGDKPWGEILPREIPPLREEKVLPVEVTGILNSPERAREASITEATALISSSALTPIKSGTVKHAETLLTEAGRCQVKTPRTNVGVVILLDFGREVSGNVEIGIAGSGSGLIDLAYGQILTDGHVKPDRADAKYNDRILLKKGRLNWQGFSPRGFRYLQLEFRRCSKDVDLEYVRVNQTTYPANLVGDFECSDPVLNNLWRAGAYTAQLCMQDTFIDSPWLERGQWAADARVLSRTAFYAFDDTKLLAQQLKQFAAGQHRDGAIPALYPAGEEKMLPDFSLLWVFSLLDYYAFSDDAGLLKDLYPAVKHLMEWFGHHLDEDGMLAAVPGHLFIDSDCDTSRGNMTMLNCLYYQALRVQAILAAIVGRQEEAEQCIERADALKLAINKLLYSPEKALYADRRADGGIVEEYGRQANTLAALFDIADHYRKSTILRQLTEGAMPHTATPYFACHLLEALYSADRHDVALDMIRKMWGPMVKDGGGTLWEYFDQEGGLCHGWSTCPTRDLLAEYAGIKPVLGSHRFSVTPHAADLEWVRGSVNTRTGPLSIEWKIGRNCFQIKLDVPPELRVDLYPPGGADTKVSLDGRTQPSRFLTLGHGSHQIKITPTRLTKRPAVDKSLEPQPVPHVEVLGPVPQPLRRHSRDEGGRRRTRRTTMRVPIGREKPAEVEETIAEVEVPRAEIEEAQPIARTGRARRGRRRSRGHTAEPAEATAVTEPTEAVQEQPAEAAHVEAPADQTSESEAPRRRRTRRGGRRHSKSGRAAGSEESREEAAQPEGHAPTAETAVEHAEAGQAQPDVESGDEKRRRTRRGGRRRHPHAAAQQEGPAVDEAPAMPPTAERAEPESANVRPESAGAEGEAPVKRRRTRGRRGGVKHRRGGTSQEPAENPTDAPSIDQPQED